MSTLKVNSIGSLLASVIHLCTTCCTHHSTLCDLNLNSAGGDEGFDQDYPASEFSARGGNLFVEFEAYSVKDQLILEADSGVLYDSGCISGHVSPTVTLPPGTTHLHVRVVPNCEGTSGTAWVLSITCELPASALRPQVLETPSSTSPIIALAKARFAVCKTCPDALDGAFHCRRWKGCCFGRLRTDPATLCPRGLWPTS